MISEDTKNRYNPNFLIFISCFPVYFHWEKNEDIYLLYSSDICNLQFVCHKDIYENLMLYLCRVAYKCCVNTSPLRVPSSFS